MNNTYQDFFMNGIEITNWNYNEHRNELEFFSDNYLVATINYSNKEFNILNAMNDQQQWNYLAELFSDDEE